MVKFLRHAKAWSLLLCMGMTGGALHAQTTGGLKIGVIGPFSGPSADFGIPMRNGIELAVEQLNASGGYLGKPIELVIKDDKANADEGLKQSQELVAAKVHAVIGFCNTGVAAKSLEVFQNARLPLIIPCTTGTPLTAKYPAPESYIFRTSARDSIQAPFVVDDIVKRGWKKVAIFADKTPYGESGLADVLKALDSKKLKPAYVARFDLGVKDLSAEMKAAKDSGADVLFSYTVGQESAVIARAKQELGWKVSQVGAWSLSLPFFLDGAKEAAEGALMAQTFIAEPSNPRRASFLTAYYKKFNVKRIPVPMAAAQGYDSLNLLMYGMSKLLTNNPTGTELKTALENLTKVYYGVVATYDKPFSAQDKDAITSNMLLMGQVKNGVVTFAYPQDAKNSLQMQRKQ